MTSGSADRSGRRFATSVLGLVVASLAGCDGEPEPAAPPFFPEDVEARYTEVRPCMPSGDHDLNHVRILADDDALAPYTNRDAPFPVGAVIVKAEYDFGDTTCSEPEKQWTVMRKLAAGAGPDTLDWEWQTVDADRVVVDKDLPRCISCHTGCGVAPDGYDGTCAILE